ADHRRRPCRGRGGAGPYGPGRAGGDVSGGAPRRESSDRPVLSSPGRAPHVSPRPDRLSPACGDGRLGFGRSSSDSLSVSNLSGSDNSTLALCSQPFSSDCGAGPGLSRTQGSVGPNRGSRGPTEGSRSPEGSGSDGPSEGSGCPDEGGVLRLCWR